MNRSGRSAERPTARAVPWANLVVFVEAADAVLAASDRDAAVAAAGAIWAEAGEALGDSFLAIEVSCPGVG